MRRVALSLGLAGVLWLSGAAVVPAGAAGPDLADLVAEQDADAPSSTSADPVSPPSAVWQAVRVVSSSSPQALHAGAGAHPAGTRPSRAESRVTPDAHPRQYISPQTVVLRL